MNRLDRFIAVLLQWQEHTNLIADSTIPELWSRHVADSLQLIPLAPEARIWIDLGSGGGFPGLAIACALADKPGTKVHLVESKAKKCVFLREAALAAGVPAIIHNQRIEDFAAHPPERADVVTARALKPLPELLALAYPLLKTGAQGLFLKGQDVDAELTEAAKCWNIKVKLVPSQTDTRGRIVVVESLESRKNKT
ncbi:MAG: rRNA (guanine527-N7)-methyltransferase [Alphaproteobacteria bacterium]|nr:rRNA (guanine527-N7)-methyltransferase [Alphaproteobacteria bacterium]